MKKAKVNIECKEEFREAINFARKNKLRQNFKNKIHALNCFKRRYNSDFTLHIGADSCEHSFLFTFYNEAENARGLNGGLILHGLQETFSVELCPKNGPHWSIHT